MTDDVFPDRNMDHLDKLSWVIEDQGWVAVPVDAQEGPPPRAGYTYTIGFTTTFGRPEVAIFGLRAVAARGLLGLIADQHAGGVELPVDAVFIGLLENDLPCALLPVDLAEHGELFPDATALLDRTGESWEVLQFVWPDRNGRFPWDEGYDERLRVAQPIVGATGA
ncbi:DUF4262 domain-containing protein [Dermatobacter hominis]|uniref:DUF4262 domain-containing protein n=1 Tax=Dermatobacter hominis TaxID=2884263 RepID=UPI001D116A1D|nr:DUF4262 domain-containing protein [Dermatobacter hominis]UDY37847.1 DUF4262 domain-containing protein [Dermatobacter hominis]